VERNEAAAHVLYCSAPQYKECKMPIIPKFVGNLPAFALFNYGGKLSFVCDKEYMIPVYKKEGIDVHVLNYMEQKKWVLVRSIYEQVPKDTKRYRILNLDTVVSAYMLDDTRFSTCGWARNSYKKPVSLQINITHSDKEST
jgi:hypothetical protein